MPPVSSCGPQAQMNEESWWDGLATDSKIFIAHGTIIKTNTFIIRMAVKRKRSKQKKVHCIKRGIWNT